MGLAVAEALVGEGANVAMFARRRELLEREADRLGAPAVPGDLTNPRDLDPPVEPTTHAFGRTQGPVNNGGRGPPGGPPYKTPPRYPTGVPRLTISRRPPSA